MATRGTKSLVIAVAVATALAGCRGKDTEPSDGPSAKAARGGTLTYYIHWPFVEHLDPQRMYIGRDISNMARTVYRSWVTFPISRNVDESTTDVADLATDTGTPEDGARTWKFTLREGPTWQDGKPVTCEDFKYGASRVFATDVITGGPNYLLSYLDIPTNKKTGLPAYEGPYTKVGQDLYDKAVTCDGKTITYHFKKPWADFPLAVASLHMMDPYRADKDRGDESSFQVFSNGPYKLEGAWDEDKGGTFVRNENYDSSTDSTYLRRALPDEIVFRLDKLDRTGEQINERLIADRGQDRAAVTGDPIPPSYFSKVTGDIAKRAVTVTSPYTEFLMPNFRRLTNLRVRQALAASVDVTAWVSAGGGDRSYREANDILNPLVRGYQEDLFPGGSGDPEKARRLLESAGVQTPYPIIYAYISKPITDKQAEALKEGWERAGFKVTLDRLGEDEYYGILDKPDYKADIISSGWGADWPSAMTVTAPLFDSRPNLTKNSNGQDLGAYRSVEFEALVDDAQRAADLDKQTKLLQQADQMLADDVAYIPLDIPVFYLLRGSDVTGYVNTAACNWYPDLGAIGVK
jgi:peptide/nickel transport system substrate-binding protein